MANWDSEFGFVKPDRLSFILIYPVVAKVREISASAKIKRKFKSNDLELE